jgi:hypothetical protein
MQVGLDFVTSTNCKSQLQFQQTNNYYLLYLTSSPSFQSAAVTGRCPESIRDNSTLTQSPDPCAQPYGVPCRFNIMKLYSYKLILFLLIITSCATSSHDFNNREYRKSKSLFTYKAMANELQDGCLILKENNYFKYYDKLWLVVNIKLGEYIGRYSQSNDTIYLNWLGSDPKNIHPYLSNKCIVDSSTKSLWFIDNSTNERLWGLKLWQ